MNEPKLIADAYTASLAAPYLEKTDPNVIEINVVQTQTMNSFHLDSNNILFLL